MIAGVDEKEWTKLAKREDEPGIHRHNQCSV